MFSAAVNAVKSPATVAAAMVLAQNVGPSPVFLYWAFAWKDTSIRSEYRNTLSLLASKF